MTGKKRLPRAPIAVACLIVAAAGVGFAQRMLKASVATGRPNINMTLAGAVEHGNDRIPVEKSEPVKPGDVIDWTIVSENKGDASAHEYKAVGQIPKGTQLVLGSATSDGSANVTYSIDNGKNYSKQPMVSEKQADGSVRQVAAPVSSYTNLRYEWSDALSQGGKVTASYKVRVN